MDELAQDASYARTRKFFIATAAFKLKTLLLTISCRVLCMPYNIRLQVRAWRFPETSSRAGRW